MSGLCLDGEFLMVKRRRELSYSEPYRRLTKPKPGPTARARAKRRRDETPVKKSVRAQCDDRDGACRIARDHDVTYRECWGPSEWAHFGPHRRSRTMGMPAHLRHTTAGSLILCRKHHRAYDSGRLSIRALSENGCDGVLVFESPGAFIGAPR